MSCDQERIYLSYQELQSLLWMAGKKELFGFQAENGPLICNENVWENCCRLMADGMITQQEGKFRLRRDLHSALQPIVQAEVAWVFMIGSGKQIIYYRAAQTAAMVKNHYGGYSVWSVENLGEEIWEHAAEELAEKFSTLTPNASTQTDVLLEDSVFLLELVDTATAIRRRWIRGAQREDGMKLEWIENDQIMVTELTEEKLKLLLD